jgi:tRNA pseudouridine55 synthase
MASGVLLVLLGEATKLSGALTLERKSYIATVVFGSSTDSDDAQGRVLETIELAPGVISDSALQVALAVERSKVSQIPPVVTAIKQDGVAAHKRLRQGLSVDVKPRDVEVFELRVLERTETAVSLFVSVSKGYYVRALARDLGSHLGVPSHLASLRRVSSGDFCIDEAVAWPPASPPELLSMVDAVKRTIPWYRLTNEGVARARVGKHLDAEHIELRPSKSLPPYTTSAWLSPDDKLVALGQFDDNGIGRVQRGFSDPTAAADCLTETSE